MPEIRLTARSRAEFLEFVKAGAVERGIVWCCDRIGRRGPSDLTDSDLVEIAAELDQSRD